MSVVYTDGATKNNHQPDTYRRKSYVCFILDGKEHMQLSNATSNNEAEYEAVIWALRYCVENGIREVDIRSDSQTVVRQCNGEYKARDLALLHWEVEQLKPLFDRLTFTWVPRKENLAGIYLEKTT